MSELTTPSADRSLKLDNIKGILIILVVLGHFGLYYLYLNPSPGLCENITKVIFFFHMPVLAFVSGYLSFFKNHISAKPYIKLLLCYVIMNTLMMLYEHLINKAAILVLVPYTTCWYPLSLIFWNLLLHVFKRCNLSHIFLISFIISIVAGLQPDISNILALKYTIALLPLFIAGYMMRRMNLSTLFDAKPVKFFAAFLAALSLALIIYLVSYFDFNLDFLQYGPYFTIVYVIERFAILAIAMFIIFSLFALVPERRIPLLTKWGKNFTTVYTFHIFVIVAFTALNPAKGYTDILLIPMSVLTLLTCLLLGSDAIGGRFKKFIDKVANGLTGDMTNPTVKKINYAALIITVLFIIYICLDPLLLPPQV